MSKEIDHEYTREVVCPWCGHEHSDSWELHMNDGDCIEHECSECEQPFIVSCAVTVQYSTEKDHARVTPTPTQAAKEMQR